MADVIKTLSGSGTGTQVYYDVDICNLAIARIGDADNYLTSTILTANNTKEARLCNLNYVHVLKMALLKVPWKCALVREEIKYDEEVTPKFDMAYSYSIPDDCLLVVHVSDDESAKNKDLKWYREGRYIYTNAYDTIDLTLLKKDKSHPIRMAFI